MMPTNLQLVVSKTPVNNKLVLSFTAPPNHSLEGLKIPVNDKTSLLFTSPPSTGGM